MELKIKTTFRYGGDAKLAMLGHRISESLKSNTNFPNPVPAHPDLEKALLEFQQALSVAGRYDRTRISAKNDKKAVLINMLSQLAVYVEATCQGDKTMLLSSGFDITGIKNDPLRLQPIHDFTVDIPAPGQATTRVNKVPGARSYVHQYTPDPVAGDSVWISETVTERQYTFNNLPSVVKHWFRVIAVGRANQKVYSPPVARVIQ